MSNSLLNLRLSELLTGDHTAQLTYDLNRIVRAKIAKNNTIIGASV